MDSSAPQTGRERYAPGLDGIRAVAVLAITAYHLRFIDGGLLSVSVFFTLSGYLITSILLGGFRRTGAIDLKTFWLRRARRLLPALLLLLLVVLVATAIASPSKLASYARQALSACFYVANWATIGRGDNYFNRFSGPGPFDHLWSLAIEEQFYAVWPLLVLGLLVVGRGRTEPTARLTRRALVPMMLVTAALAVASALSMALRYVPNAINNTRAYEGTDTRAAPILIGALTAMFLPLDAASEGGRARRVVLDVLGVVSCAVVVVVVARTDEYSPFLYRGGEPVVSVATAALVLAAAHPDTLVARLFGVAPLRWLGVRSYGVYLWHMPVVAFVPMSMLEGRPFVRGALQLSLIVALAALSWTLLEDPIRRHGLRGAFATRAGRTAGRRWAGTALLVPLATCALAPWPLLSPASAGDLDPATLELMNGTPETQPGEPSPLASVAPAPGAALSSCAQVVHVGDSTSLGLMSKRYLPLAEDRLDARYRAVGVSLFVAEISGGRSIVERLNDHPSAYEVVSAKSATGYKGCWVFALGIGDAATIRGNVPALSKRIDWMMDRASGAPVLWTTTKTLHAKGPYQNAYMDSWNQALSLACVRHPNMRVFDWASEVQDGWYLPDRIHPNEVGSKERAARLASALANAFPRDRAPHAGCLVRSTPP